MKDEQINLKEIFDEIENLSIHQIQNEQKEIDENFNEVAKKRAGIMHKLWTFMLRNLLGSLKVKITIYWKEKEIFNYVIPKD